MVYFWIEILVYFWGEINRIRNRSPSLPFISLHFCIGEAFIKSPHKSLNASAAIIISPHSLDFSRDISYQYQPTKIKINRFLFLNT